jgi:hypothetical protein
MNDDTEPHRHRRVATLAQDQHSCFTYHQAIGSGFTRSAILRMLRMGVWERVTDGIYRPAGAPLSWEAEVMAAVLGVPGSVAAFQTAARLRTLPTFAATRPELAVMRHTNHEERLAIVHELKDLAAADVAMVGPIPVTTVARTIVDLAAIHRRPRLERVLDDALVRRLTTVDEVSRVLERVARRGKPGVRLLRALLAARAEGLVLPTSELERTFYKLLDDSTLPVATRQWHAPWWDSPAGHVDAAWPDYGVIAEVDGRRWHSRDQDDERDKFRDGVAARHGFHVRRFSHRQVTEDGAWVLGVLEGLLRSRMHRSA